MMKIKQITFSIILLFFVSIFSSCEYFVKKEIEPVSTLTTNPIFVLTNGDVVTWKIGDTWVEPGYTCSEVEAGKTDLNSKVIVDASKVDINNRGLYQITYTATNSYGYTKTVYRNVLVTEDLDNLTDISGNYFIGFVPEANGGNTMKIEQAEVKGFWKVSNIKNKSEIVEGYIADLGDNTYIVAKALFKRKISNLRYVYLEGDAVYDETTKKITFTLTEVYDDGLELSDSKSTTWNYFE